MDQLSTWIEGLYQIIGLEVSANSGDVWGLLTTLGLLLASSSFAFQRKTSTQVTEIEERSQAEKTEPPKTPTKPWTQRLKEGLGRSHEEVWGRVTGLFQAGKVDDELIEEVEELLYGADLGPQTVQAILEELESKVGDANFSEAEFKTWLFEWLKGQIDPVQEKLGTTLFTPTSDDSGPRVVMVVGVNGAGKTTTIGKLATKWTQQGSKVVVGACDTFRAAAVDQLQVWCERSGAKMVRAKEGSNPSGVGYEALQQAINEKADYCLLDTAGRLHTKSNLMDELVKSKNVLSKLDPNAPHEILLVIDAITGQNAVRQAQEFHQALGLTGLIFTKCDGSSKAGSAVSIVQQLQVPLTYIGVGEGVDDLNIFNSSEYLKALLDIKE